MHFPLDEIRNRFPALSGPGQPPIYLDNPAGTLVPRSVIDAVATAMATASSNLGGYFAASQRAGDIWTSAHDAAADLVGAKSAREVIIGANMTTLTLHLSRSIGRLMKPGDEIIVTRMDHEGDVSPWLLMAEDLKLNVKWLNFNRETWRIEPEELRPLLSDRTKLLALNYASNLTGSINDVKALTALAKAAGALVYVDAVQLTPHRLPDVLDLGCDFLACSSYKFFGPHLGVVWGREELLASLTPYKVRCASDALPERFETGTPQVELLAGLAATVDYLASVGEMTGHGGSRRAKLAGAYAASDAYETTLTQRLVAGLKALPGVTIHGITNPNRFAQRVPTVSFTHDRISTHVFAERLAAQDIYIWSGHNYAYELARQLGLKESEGVVRIGMAHYNSLAEVERCLSAVAAIVTEKSPVLA